ncbi:MAG: GntR family transcriptional regulator [Pirellula sp.]|jgi:GntR family transcriptional regulator/MocR family aminotransferase
MSKTASSLDLNLVRLDRRKSISLTAQLYESLRDAIQAGLLSKGFRLPSTRELAQQLSVSRTTVINAFDQLIAEGYLTAADDQCIKGLLLPRQQSDGCNVVQHLRRFQP